MRRYFFLLPMFFTSSIMNSQISPDNSFGVNGKTDTSFGTQNSTIATLCVQTDGKIIACGSYYNGTINQIALSRYNVDGSSDNSFGNNGKILTPIGTKNENEHNSVRVLSNGKILVAAANSTTTSSCGAIVRYNADGTLDSGFGNNGILLSDFSSVYKFSALEIQPDNKIVVGGFAMINSSGNNPDFAVARYNEDGSKDLSFGSNGLAIINIGTIGSASTISEDYLDNLKIQPDGKILASGLTTISSIKGGANFGLIRLNTNGSLDNNFGNNGRVITDFGETEEANSINVLSDGKIILSGIYYYNDDSNEKVAIAKYNADGTLDSTYGTNGKIITDFGKTSPVAFAFESAIQKDGKLLVTGIILNTTADFFILRYNIDGSLDTTFDSDGYLFIDSGINEGATALILQSDGKLILGGIAKTDTGTDFALLRFSTNVLGLNDYAMGKNEFKVYPNPVSTFVNLDSNLNQSATISVELYDSDGRKISNLLDSKNFQSGFNSQKLELPETLSKGVYFLNISDGKKTSIIKLIK